ncbi:non-ribosomal peptide synthetase [Bacillus sp. ISTL8]|uniref:non-ribosomal peptide synthetase n=1 Tax=Bacillus sp. ISTL8 TaxID=2596896 RepID=UPI0014576E11|nr:non-ribosomal peptide synthetase [Bacillus sp. ISTL8]
MDIKNIENIYECTPLQKGMLFHAIHQPDTSLYIEQVKFKLSEGLDASCFQKAWERTINRHSALRTTFHWKESEKLLQVVHKKIDIVWENKEWNQHAEHSSLTIDQYAEKLQKEGFDVSKGSPMKFHLIRLNEGYQFIWTFHHLLMDGWSMSLVLRDVILCYQSLKRNELPELLGAPQFHEYISWIGRQDIEHSKQFFKEKLKGFVEPSYLCGSHYQHRQVTQDQHKDIIISDEKRKSLEELARKQEVTLFSILQGLWVILINSYTDQEDVVLGSVMSGRQPDIRGAESIVGPFINTLPIRVRMKSSNTLLSVIKDVQKEQSELSQYQHTPLYEVQKVSELDSDKPLFDSIIVFENYPFDFNMFKEGNIGISISDFQVEEKSNFPLSLAIIPFEDALVLRLHFDSSVITVTEIEKMLDRMARLVEAALQNVHQTLDSLNLLDERDQKDVEAWGNGKVPSLVTSTETLHGKFEQQVQLCEEKIAVRNETVTYTYKELDEQANQLAGHLQRLGLKKEQSVAVMMGKSPDFIIAMLGILKAGGVYVPLDKHMPEERIQYILNDSEVQFIVVDENIPEIPFGDVDIVNIDAIPDGEMHSRLVIPPKQSAYIMYTSGSTGLPKGVAVSHEAAFLHYVSFMEKFNLSETDRVLQFGTITFDPSLEQIFPTLFSGGEVFVRGEDLWDSEGFVENINNYGITIANLPTPYWNEIVNHYIVIGQSIIMNSLRILAVGGDKLSTVHANKWNDVHRGKTSLYNFYGPTEIVTTCTHYLVQNQLYDTAAVSIGYPFSNRRLYILDSMGRPVPSGGKGELHIGGPVLARGYINKPGLTAEKFVPDPFSSEPGARMYRTGDIVRYSPDGDIQFLGRNDDQFKIRGFRVETGEIEKVLLSLPEVNQALVMVDSTSETKVLIAYITVIGEALSKEIKVALESKLPNYMIPKFIHVMEELPLMTNGKVDRKALPRFESFKNTDFYHPPINETQKKLVTIWEQVLQVEKVGIQDNYFELGGDSILALQIIAKSQEVSIDITTRDLFEYQTIKKIDDFLSHKTSRSTVDLLEENGEESLIGDIVPFTPIQQWFFEKELNNPHHWNQSLLLKVKEDLDITSLDNSIEAITKYHEVFNISFVHEEGKWGQTEELENRYVLDVMEFDNQSSHDQERKRQVILQAQKSLDIECGPLLKIVYFRNKKNGENQLFITIHHLIVDGVSWRILLEDLQIAYNQIQERKPLKFLPQTTLYKEWSFALQHYAKGEEIRKNIPYWKRMSKVEMRIPVDWEKNEAVNTESSLKKKTARFSKKETEFLLTKVNRTLNAKIQEILISSLMIAMKRWTHGQNIKIDIEGHGREAIRRGINLSRTVGWFTTLFPFSVKLQERSSLLEDVNEIIRAMQSIPDNGIEFGVLKYLRGVAFEEHPSEVSFNYLGQINTTFENSIFEIADESVEPIRDSAAPRAYLLDVEGAVYNGELSLDWMYSSHLHKDETIELLVSEFCSIVREIIKLGMDFEGKLYLPSNFNKVNLNETEWKLINQHTATIEDMYPLSPVQEGILFHTLMHPETGIYMEQMAIGIKGEFSIEAFCQAWQHVLDRNSILRANFLWEGFTKPIHIIHQSRKVNVNVLDWTDRAYEFDDLRQNLERINESQRLTGFDLEHDSLIRLTLVKIEKNTYHFIWTYHHLLLDGWSMPMVLMQLSEAYAKITKGEKLDVTITRSFGEYIDWQTNQDFSKDRDFWIESLEGYQDRAMLTMDSGRISDREQSHLEIKRKLPKVLTEKLKVVAAEKKTTLNTMVQTAWAIFLNFVSEKEKVIFGSVFSGRSAPVEGIEEMIGMFINTLPMSLKVSSDKKLRELLLEMHSFQLRVSTIESTPLTEIKEWIGYKSKESLFDTCLIFANFPNLISPEGNQAFFENATIFDVDVTEQTNFPLTLSIAPGERLSLDINYSCVAFSSETIECYLHLLENILTEMTVSHEQSVKEIQQKLQGILIRHNQEMLNRQKEINRNQLNRRIRKSVNVPN